MTQATWNGTVIADSDATIVVEGNHYFPLHSVTAGSLKPSRRRTLCIWKGLASYYDVEADGVRTRNAAWAYRHPYPWIRRIKRRVAFGPGVDVSPG